MTLTILIWEIHNRRGNALLQTFINLFRDSFHSKNTLRCNMRTYFQGYMKEIKFFNYSSNHPAFGGHHHLLVSCAINDYVVLYLFMEK
jgi:hypothetical protein